MALPAAGAPQQQRWPWEVDRLERNSGSTPWIRSNAGIDIAAVNRRFYLDFEASAPLFILIAGKRCLIPAAQPMTVFFQVTKCIRQVSQHCFYRDGVGGDTLIEISVIER